MASTMTVTLTRSDSWASTASLISSSTSTGCDTTSGSSTSTVPGPGALTGKALKALGKVTLRGFGRVVMAKHLATVTYIFPHSDEQASHIRNIEDIYDDLLEFSRPGLYSSDTFERALKIILVQIGRGHTRYLVKALACWHAVELHILLSEIFLQLAPLWNPSLQLIFSSSLFRSYSETQPFNPLSPIPLILFISKLVRTGARACGTVLQVGFLDVLLSIFNSNHIGMRELVGSHLLTACNAALLDMTAYLEYRPLVLHHPISSTWPQKNPPTLVDITPLETRMEALLLGVNKDVVLDDCSPFLSISLVDICSQPCISTIPPEQLLHSLTFDVIHDQALRVFLVRSDHNEKVSILSGLIRRMPVSVAPDDKTDSFVWRYRHLFCLHLITEIAQIDSACRQALIDVGAIEYLILILRAEIPESYFTRMVLHEDFRNIPKIIRERGLSSLLNGRGAPSTRIQRSVYGAFSALCIDDATKKT